MEVVVVLGTKVVVLATQEDNNKGIEETLQEGKGVE